MKALILNNKIVQISETEFHVNPEAKWVDCDSSVEIGYYYDSGTFKESLLKSSELLTLKKGEKVKSIKSVARQKILDIYSAEDQRNVLMSGDNSTISTMNTKIKKIRGKSNSLESSLSAMTAEEISALDLSDNKNWK